MCVCVFLVPVVFNLRVDVTPYCLSVSEFVFMCLSIKPLFHKFIVRRCVTVRDKDNTLIIAKVLWLHPC